MTARSTFTYAAAALLLSFGLGVMARAQSASHQPDLKRGATIATDGTEAGAPGCAACHAVDGSQNANAAFPTTAGQPAYYLKQQLYDFSSNIRANDVMSPIAKAMSPEDIADVSAYYASVNAASAPAPQAADRTLVERGERLARLGSAEKRVPGCDNCHGPQGFGEPPVIPYLAGQSADYIAAALKAWQSGDRKNSAEVMLLIAKSLDDGDIAAVAAYYAQARSSVESKASIPKTR